MATKTFKIGLSNTDKQNMAQDVYERLLALTFPEYDTSTSYSVGDFVVYNYQLYKCIGATTGAWDSTKWQLATLNDLVADIEDAVAFVNDKANVDGNYPTMTVGVADNLSPYDEESGDDQDEPFNFQATGTGNGTQPDFSTGSISLMKEKRGNSVVVNQKVSNPTFSNSGQGWNFYNSSYADNGLVGDGSAEIYAYQSIIGIVGHTYLFYVSLETNAPSLLFRNSNTWYTLDAVQGKNYIANATECTQAFSDVVIGSFSATTGTYIKNITYYCIDLTQWFNGDIPQDLLDNPSNFFRYYQGDLSYNTGELVNANGRYVKCIGRNQWDEVATETGFINDNGEVVTGYDYRIASTNLIKVIPDTYYYFNVSYSIPNNGIRLAWYDCNGNLIKVETTYGIGQGNVLKSPTNACYMRFAVDNNGYNSSTYRHDITISLYYEGESGYDQYYPYEVLTETDTGNEVLRSAGSVRDYKEPNGTIHRLVGRVDLGDLDWNKSSSYDHAFFYVGLPLRKRGRCDNHINALYSLYSTTFGSYFGNNAPNMSICFSSDTDSIQIYIRNDNYSNATDFKNAMTGVYLFYELAEETTEQGTPYSENLVIDDFGSMDFQGTNGVPQGNLIFYPVDYKAFIDTLYNTTEGTPSNVALKSDITTEANNRRTADAKLAEISGGVLRQVLCVKESLDFEDTDYLDLGSLTYSYYPNGSTESVDCYISSSADVLLKNNAKAISSRFITSSTSTDPIIPNSFAIGSGSSKLYIWVTKNAYTDATTFKNAVKGDLLAYEKA